MTYFDFLANTSVRKALLNSLILISVCVGTSMAQTPCPTPVFGPAPATIMLSNSPNNCTPVANFYPTVTDYTDIEFRIAGATLARGSGTGSGSSFNPGTSHVYLTATNKCGSTEQIFDVIVKDVVGPSIAGIPNITTNTDAGSCTAIVNYPEPDAKDICSGCAFTDLEAKGFLRLGDYDGHSYFRTPKPGTWQDMEAAAQSVGAHLVAINSFLEDSMLNEMLPDTMRAWIGLTDEVEDGVWKWTSGDTFIYEHWCVGNPDGGAAQDYGLLHSEGTFGTVGCWDDANTGIGVNEFYGIVEVPTCGLEVKLVRGLPSGSAFPVGATTVTYEAKDGFGHQSSMSFVVTVNNDPKVATINPTVTDPTYTGNEVTNIYLGYGPQTVNVQAVPPLPELTNYVWSAATTAITTGTGQVLSCATCTSPWFTPKVSGTYRFMVTISNNSGCTAVQEVTFCVKDVRDGDLIKVCEAGELRSYQKDAVAGKLADSNVVLGECNSPCTPLTVLPGSGGNGGLVGSEVTVYPNPSGNSLVVEVPPSESTAYVTLRDFQGKVIETRQIQENDSRRVHFDMSSRPVGMYVLETAYNDQHTRTKVMRQ